MADKKKYYKLDDIGIVGKQEKKSPGNSNYHSKKTGEIFRAHRQSKKSNSSSSATARHKQR